MLTTQEWYFPSTRWIYYVCINIIFPPVAVLLYCCTLWRLLFSPRFLSFVCCCCCCWCSLGVVMITRDCLWLPGWLDSWLVDSGWHSERRTAKETPQWWWGGWRRGLCTTTAIIGIPRTNERPLLCVLLMALLGFTRVDLRTTGWVAVSWMDGLLVGGMWLSF